MAERTVTVSVTIPEDMEWSEVATIEDSMSEAVDEVMKTHGLNRQAHERHVKADYGGCR